MRIKEKAIGIFIILFLFGVIVVTSMLGIFETQSTKNPAKFESGKYAGEYNPDDIRGSYSFGEISELFNIPLIDLGNAFGIEEYNQISTFKCKDLEGIYADVIEDGEVGTDSVKTFVALFKGLPITLNNETYFPETTKEILMNTGNLEEEEQTFLVSHLVTTQPISSNLKTEEAEEESENVIKGKTTFQEIITMGIKKEDIEKAIGYHISNSYTVIRDFCTQNGIEYSTVKGQIQSLITK